MLVRAKLLQEQAGHSSKGERRVLQRRKQQGGGRGRERGPREREKEGERERERERERKREEGEKEGEAPHRWAGRTKGEEVTREARARQVETQR
jgi:hypothetical protein